MVHRVTWIAALLVALTTAGWGITIPITSTSNTGLNATAWNTYGGVTGGTQIAARANDPNWNFYTFSGDWTNPTSATAVGDYVTLSSRPPLSTGAWAANSALSQWISPVENPCASGSNSRCDLPTVTGTSYLAATTFTVPAMTNPPSLPQWWLVMSGTVWADDSIGGMALYSGNTPSGTAVYSRTFAPSIAGPLTSAAFSLKTWVNPNQTYTLAFLLNNTANSWAGFRLQFSEKYVTPEPGAWVLMLSAGAGLVFASWRRRRTKKPQA